MKFMQIVLLGVVLGASFNKLQGFAEEYETHGAFDRLYPITNFKRVEIICRELWFDLDFLYNNQELQKKIAGNSNYLVNQFLLLERYLNRMAHDSQESISYLREDIDYLAGMIENFATKYNEIHIYLAGTHNQSEDIKFSVMESLERSKKCIEQLFSHNKEVMFGVI